MTAQHRSSGGSPRGAVRRLASAFTALLLAAIFVGLWLVVITRGEVLTQ
jgi:hypothetical protein